MHSYKNLAAYCQENGIKNVEQNLEIIAEHFSDLFDLNALDDEARLGKGKYGYYFEFFIDCLKEMEKTSNKYSADEQYGKIKERLIIDLYYYLHQEQGYWFHCLFIKKMSNEAGDELLAAPDQPGYLEKLAVGTLKKIQSLEFLDIWRGALTFNLNENPYVEKAGRLLHKVYVLNQKNIEVIFKNKYHSSIDIKALYIIDINVSEEKIPKWVVVNTVNNQVYCSAILSSQEKRKISHAFNQELIFLKSLSHDWLTSGYMALKWVGEQLEINPETQAMNFWETRYLTSLLFYPGKNSWRGGLHFSPIDRFCCTHEYQSFYGTFSSISQHDYSVLEKVSRLGEANLPEFGKFESYDIANLLKLIAEKKISQEKVKAYYQAAQRYLVAGFDHALLTFKDADYGQLAAEKIEDGERILHITIPASFDQQAADRLAEHYITANPLIAGYHLIWNVTTKKRSGMIFEVKGIPPEDLAIAAVLCLLRTRAKREVIVINLPQQYQLSETELEVTINLMQDNPYIQHLEVNKDNASLLHLQKSIIPYLARNRLLAICHYRPAEMADYWLEAAQKWMEYLFKREQKQQKQAEEVFLACLQEMGVQGLDALLRLLNERQPIFKLLLDNQELTFDLTCAVKDTNQYFDRLLAHIQEGSYFPFGHIVIHNTEIDPKKLMDFIFLLNTRSEIKSITFSRRVPVNLLNELIALAKEQPLITFIHIGELESEAQFDPINRYLIKAYMELNNIILNNQRELFGNKLKQDLQENKILKFGLAKEEFVSKDKSKGKEKEKEKEKEKDLQFTVTAWPLKKEKLGLQMQYEQQQQVVHEMEQIQPQKDKASLEDFSLDDEELVSYQDIDKNISLLKDKQFLEIYAALRSNDESLLQGLFHTWINANPNVRASHVIAKMSKEAIYALLKNPACFAAGIDYEHLPKGFFLVRDEENNLVLGYHPFAYYPEKPSVYTLKPHEHAFAAEKWRGDYRQLSAVTTETLLPLAFYAYMQEESDHRAQQERFLYYNPNMNAVFEKNLIIRKHWLIFLQIWQLDDNQLLEEFYQADDSIFDLSPQQALNFLLKEKHVINSWIQEQDWTKQNIQALGQIYYRYGSEGIIHFCSQLKHLQETLGQQFYSGFKACFIDHSHNLCELLLPNGSDGERFDIVLSEMQKYFTDNPEEADIWLTLLTKHFEKQTYASLLSVWHAYLHFAAYLKEHQLVLQKEVVEALTITNFIVNLSRIQSCLEKLADDKKQAFLQQLPQLDLSQGGALYALCYEEFREATPELRLTDFYQGTPTYKPSAVDLFDWNDKEAALYIRRSLASVNIYTGNDYERLLAFLFEEDGSLKVNARIIFFFLSHTQYDCSQENWVEKVIKQIEEILELAVDREGEPKKDEQGLIIDLLGFLHTAIYTYNNPLKLELNFLWNFFHQSILEAANITSLSYEQYSHLKEWYPAGEWLEAMNLLAKKNAKIALYYGKEKERDTMQNVYALYQFFQEQTGKSSEVVLSPLKKQCLQIATLFSIFKEEDICNILIGIKDLSLAAQAELSIFFSYLLSIHWQNSENAAIYDLATYKLNLIDCIENIKKSPDQAHQYALSFIKLLTASGIAFQQGLSGTYRTIREEDYLAEIAECKGYEAALWQFLSQHVVLAMEDDKQVLKPLVHLFRTIILNRGSVDAAGLLFEFLLTIPKNHYFSVAQLTDILTCLMPASSQAVFPISLFKIILEYPIFGARDIDQIQKKFPVLLASTIEQLIVKTSQFNRQQQQELLHILLRVYTAEGSVLLFNRINELLVQMPANLKDIILKRLNQAVSIEEEYQWLRAQKLLVLLNVVNLDPRVIQFYLENMHEKWVEEIYALIVQQDDIQTTAYLLQIIANSQLAHPGKQAARPLLLQKLLPQLFALAPNELKQLADCSATPPIPNLQALRRLLKEKRMQSAKSWESILADFKNNPYLQVRADYGKLTKGREQDFKRMMATLLVRKGKYSSLVGQDAGGKIKKVFEYLKQIEAGEIQFNHDKGTCALSDLSEKGLYQASKEIAEEDLELLEAKKWAILFEVIARTTGKYPHLAQQLALISANIINSDNDFVLQLATGEGKSHILALRAAYYVLFENKEVDICTAKRTLAERDHEDYAAFFHALKIKTTIISATSSAEDYNKAQVRYTTNGEFSLFVDARQWAGQSLKLDESRRIGLFDEFDAIRFKENQSTQYNLSSQSGLSVKDKLWFYNAVNIFFDKKYKDKTSAKQYITQQDINEFIQFLFECAGDNEYKKKFLKDLVIKPQIAVQWLQAAASAFGLQQDKDYVLRHAQLTIGEEIIEAREVVPLSAEDNELMLGSTFSDGVQQLLIVRLNQADIYLPPESDKVSSQIASARMQELWGKREGFTGTISPQQAEILYRENGMQVLEMPNNYPSLRRWLDPVFCEDEESRLEQIISQVKAAFEKQHSILFACRNDQEVKNWQQVFKEKLSKQEYAQFIFFTNDQAGSAEEALKQKQELEKKGSGSKQQGVAIVASSLGRGDNPDVEMVIITDVAHHNDRLQKGGRTARKGGEGCVCEFYLLPELEAEFIYLKEQAEKLGNKTEVNDLIKHELQSDLGLKNQQLLDNVLVLREYLHRLQAKMTQAYRQALAEYCHFVMNNIFSYSQPEEVKGLRLFWQQQLTEIAEDWTDIEAHSEMNEAEKIKCIQEKILGYAYHLQKECAYYDISINKSFEFKGNSFVALSHGEEVALSNIHIPSQLNSEEEQQRRLIIRIETLAVQLNEIEANRFHEASLKLLQHLDRKFFTALLHKTEKWWNKKRFGTYQPELILLFDKLSQLSAEELSAIDPFLFLLLKKSDKSWFQYLSLFLQLPNQVLISRSANFMQVLDLVNAGADFKNLKKSEKRKLLALFLDLHAYGNFASSQLYLIKRLSDEFGYEAMQTLIPLIAVNMQSAHLEKIITMMESYQGRYKVELFRSLLCLKIDAPNKKKRILDFIKCNDLQNKLDLENVLWSAKKIGQYTKESWDVAKGQLVIFFKQQGCQQAVKNYFIFCEKYQDVVPLFTRYLERNYLDLAFFNKYLAYNSCSSQQLLTIFKLFKSKAEWQAEDLAFYLQAATMFNGLVEVSQIKEEARERYNKLFTLILQQWSQKDIKSLADLFILAGDDLQKNEKFLVYLLSLESGISNWLYYFKCAYSTNEPLKTKLIKQYFLLSRLKAEKTKLADTLLDLCLQQKEDWLKYFLLCLDQSENLAVHKLAGLIAGLQHLAYFPALNSQEKCELFSLYAKLLAEVKVKAVIMDELNRMRIMIGSEHALTYLKLIAEHVQSLSLINDIVEHSSEEEAQDYYLILLQLSSSAYENGILLFIKNHNLLAKLEKEQLQAWLDIVVKLPKKEWEVYAPCFEIFFKQAGCKTYFEDYCWLYETHPACLADFTILLEEGKIDLKFLHQYLVGDHFTSRKLQALLFFLNQCKEEERKLFYALYAAYPQEALLYETGLISYLLHYQFTGNEEVGSCINGMHLFYQVLSAAKDEQKPVFVKCKEIELFDFSTAEMKALRLLLLTMLEHESLLMQTPDFTWDFKQNKDFLAQAYATYLERAQSILAERPQTLSFADRHDLKLEQRKALVDLSDELKTIGSARIRNRAAQPVSQELKGKLKQTLTHYQKASWLSRARQQQAKALRKKIKASLFKLDKGKEKEKEEENKEKLHPYTAILESLREAKLQAMQSDRAQNKKAWFFMQNRKGYSRYYNTLNQMQDMVLRAIAQDQDALKDFQSYRQHMQKEVDDLMQILRSETEPLFANKKYQAYKAKKQDNQIRKPSFFGERKNLSYDVLMQLEKWCKQAQGRSSIKDKYVRQLEEIANNDQLPPHIKTIVQQLQQPYIVLHTPLKGSVK